MKLNYLQRTGSTIFLRITHQNFNCFVKTQYSITPADWNSKLQQSKTDAELNIKLLELRSSLQSNLLRLLNGSKSISLDIVKNSYNEIVNPTVKKEFTLLEYIGIFCKSCNSIYTKNKTLTMRNQIANLPPVNLADVDFKWLSTFQKLLINQNYAASYINKNLTLVTQVLRYAAVNDIAIKQSCFSVKALKENSISHYLNNEELERIFSLQNLSPRLENTRKLFLIGCHTGLRVSDLMRINDFKIEDGFFHLQTKKTKSNVVIPIAPRIKDFIGNVKPLTLPVFNRYIKELCKLAGIKEIVEGYIEGNERRIFGKYEKWQCISSHSMRRSFASNLYGKLPTPVIMAITTHKTESSFLKYIKKPQLDSAKALKAYFERSF